MTHVVSVVAARRHPPEYELHKYWSRKPANVLHHFLASLISPGDVVVDPFCGSGVCVREAALLGAETFGFDVNPVAVSMTGVTTDPADFSEQVLPVLDAFEALCDDAYAASEPGQVVRFAVHEMGVDCDVCATRVWATEATSTGRRRSCPSCGATLRFNLERMRATRVTEVATGSLDTTDSESCRRQQAASENPFHQARHDYDRPLWTNPRTLAHPGMTTADLFTPRNFSLVAWLADELHAIEDDRVRAATLLMLTGGVAQCSRLIAYRGRLTTGGPAWTVPGFWIPPVHLEGNPAKHMRSRYRRFQRGLAALAARRPAAPARVQLGDAAGGMRKLREDGRRADVVFLDPPYGDSIPYVEFSTFWNAFLLADGDARADLSVSDRTDEGGTWERYEAGIGDALAAARLLVKPDGRLLITFNSHDTRAWRALLGALQREGLRCEFVTYQVPAVIPTKAQFAPTTSYVSDIYSVYGLADAEVPFSTDLAPVEQALIRCAQARGGRLYRNLALRTVSVEWMANDISVDLLDRRDVLIAGLFDAHGDELVLREPVPPGTPQLADIAVALATDRLESGAMEWHELYEAVATDLLDVGLPDPGELKQLLGDLVEFDGSRCRLASTAEQLHLC